MIETRTRLVRAAFAALLCGLALAAAGGVAARRAAPAAQATNTFDLRDFGAVGDGETDDAPALRAALDALAAAGGGTLHVPAGRYVLASPVDKDFRGLADSVSILGVPSDTTVDSNGLAHEMARGLGLASEFYPRTGDAHSALWVRGLRSLLVKDLAFVGTPGVLTDAAVTLGVDRVEQAVVRHCEFYGLSTHYTGAIVYAWRSGLTVEQSKFLGSVGNSGVYIPVIQNVEWKAVSVSDVIFLDYGLRELYGKTGYGAPYSWINVANAAAVTPDSPRREVSIRRVFLDEGGYVGLSSLPFHWPQPPTAPIDLYYVTGLRMNVSNLGTSGHYFEGLNALLVEDSRYGWSHYTDSAINVLRSGDVILDRVRTEAAATRLRAAASTSRLTVINSVYKDLASAAQTTRVIETVVDEDDPVWYVRREFIKALGREPDAAGHYYWTRRLLDCADAACVTARRAALADYLGDNPAPNFALGGVLTDEFGRPVAGAAVALSGSQVVSTVTDAEGRYRFSNLPTSGVYTVSASKRHYTFDTPQVITTPAGDLGADLGAALNRYAVRGRVTDLGGAGVAGAAVTLSGSQAAQTTTDSAGNYSLPGLAAGGSYTVSASGPRHTITPASHSFTDLASDKAADFTATPRFHTVAGRLAKSDNSGVSGVTVTLSGSKLATATTDAQGNYSFADLPRGGSYTVTPPVLFGHTFSPASQTFDNVTADKAANFTAVTTNHKITGRVAEGGAGLSGVTVSLSGSHAATATTDAAGNYTLNVPAHGSYTVTPSRTHYTFAPASASFNAVGADRTADFSATLNRHKISGRVARPSGAAMAGVTVTLAGGQSATATTDALGNYSFTSLPAGRNYTVTPTRAGYDFAPGNRAFNNLGSDQTADFSVTPSDVQIAGRVTAAGAALASATVTLSGTRAAAATTDAQGNYSFTVSSEGSYTVAPSKRHYTFAPAGASFTNPTSNRTADFAATLDRHAIAGRVTKQDGTALQGATVTLSGSQSAATTTDAQGHYSFANLPAGGTYTVSVARAHYTFAAPSQTFQDLATDQTADFTATLNRHSISGRVKTQDGTALQGATVTLAGGQSAAATTDASGNFAFANLPAGGNYTVSVARAHYTFASAAQTFQDLAADQTADFTGALVSYRVGGRVAEGGAGLSGVTINLSGARTATAMTDAQGNYSFTLPAEGAYAVTASKRHYTFAPASATFASLDGDKTSDFAATLDRHAIAGRVTKQDGTALQGATVTLSGAQTSVVTTDASGNYSFASLPAGGNYTVSVARAHYTFATASRPFNDLAADQAADFEGALVSYRVSGRATEGSAGVGGANIAVTGSQTATATTDAVGNYSFTLPAEGSYTITASKRHYTFAPAAVEVASLDGDKAADFTASFAPHRISGRITEKGAALPGVTVRLAGTHPALGAQAAQAVTAADGTYSLAVSAGGDYVLTPSKQNYTFDPAAASFADLGGDRTADFSATQQTVVEFGAAAFSASEGAGSRAVTVTRGGDTSGETTVTYTAEDVSARQGHDLGTVVGQLTFAPGETTKTVTLFVTDDVFVEGPESVTLRLAAGGETLLGGGGAASFTIHDNDTAGGAANPIDDARFFVRQQYLDFLNRAPDQAGLDFWAAPIEACGADAACADARRMDASAAFFLSIEFQETGFLVHRLYKVSYGRAPRRVGEFLLDSRLISDGVAVGAPGWVEKLAANKRAFYQSWVRRPEFRSRFDALSDEQFAEALIANMGLAPDAPEREALLAALRRGAPRHEVLAEAAAGERFSRQETAPAFVLMQYFGYLQRDPDEAPDVNLDGYNFWLRKLEANHGDWRTAEMVKAFLVSIEYRHRFGQ